MPDTVVSAMFARNSHEGGPYRRANSRTPRQTTVDPRGLELRTPQQRLELRMMMTIPGAGGHEMGSQHSAHFSIESEQKAHILASVWSDWSSVLGPQLHISRSIF